MNETKIEIEDLKKHFPINEGILARISGNTKELKAVDGVSLQIREGESLGIAGESGCGKTTLGKTVLRLHDPTSGSIYFEGEDISTKKQKELKSFRQEAQIIHQDPYKALNPQYKVFRWVKEPLDVHGIGTREERAERVYRTIQRAGLSPAETYAQKHPSELSGGERQRVGIARSIVLDPSFLVCDEPVSMLDVSIRASIIDLLEELQNDIGLSALYISHDLSLLKHVCDRIAIMYLGRIVEIGPANQVINDPKHPYTQALVASTPVIDPDVERERVKLEGEVPDPVNLPSGCRFASRCPEVMEECRGEEPIMYDVDEDQEARCILYEDNAEAATSLSQRE